MTEGNFRAENLDVTCVLGKLLRKKTSPRRWFVLRGGRGGCTSVGIPQICIGEVDRNIWR